MVAYMEKTMNYKNGDRVIVAGHHGTITQRPRVEEIKVRLDDEPIEIYVKLYSPYLGMTE